MVELKNAKCPNCGASLQVNEKLNKTICQFCGSSDSSRFSLSIFLVLS